MEKGKKTASELKKKVIFCVGESSEAARFTTVV